MTAPPASSSGPQAPRWKMPSLHERAQQAFKPGAPQADVDLLVAALAPDAPREVSTQEFARLLQRIIADPRLSARQDRSGRPVRHLAAEALQALGAPYAAQLPANALPGRQLSAGFDRRALIGLLLLAVVAVVELLALIGAAVLPHTFSGPQGLIVAVPSVVGLPRPTLGSEWKHLVSPASLCLLPTLFTLWAWRTRREDPLHVAAVTLWSCAGVRLLLFAIGPGSGIYRVFGVFLFTSALMALAGICFRPRWEPERQPQKQRGPRPA